MVSAEPLAGGLRNANLKLHLDNMPEPVVLRIYEHDPSLCQKELDLLGLVRRGVPVPEVIYAQRQGVGDLPPFAIMQYIEGISFLALKRSGDRDAIAQAACSAGETLAAIGNFAFDRHGWIAPGPAVTAPLLEGADPLPRFLDHCLGAENLKRRMPAALRDRTSAVIWSRAPVLANLSNEARLVHGDFSRRNLLVRNVAGKWQVSAVVDWEFAISATPLTDFGNFLRYDPAARPWAEPYFSNGYTNAGGILPDDWRRLARLVDLTALCESLTHNELPGDVEAELVEIVRATIEGLS